MTEQFELIQKQIEELYRGDRAELRRAMQLEQFVASSVEISNRIASDTSSATYTPQHKLNPMQLPETEQTLNNLKRDIEIISGVMRELHRINTESLSRVEEKLERIGESRLIR